MLDLSFNTKSNVPAFAMYLNAKILFTFYVGLFHTHLGLILPSKLGCLFNPS